MSIEWKVTRNSETQRSLHHSQCRGGDKALIQQAVEASVEKAIELLSINIQDDSLYFLVEWHNHSTFTIVVTNDSKESTAPEVVSCELAVNPADKDYYAVQIPDWVRDYLTTSQTFIRFSLVAVFGFGDRSRVILL